MEHNCMLTTIDNPYDPFDDFTLWYLYDVQHDYNSCGILMRIANISSDLSQKEIDEEIERAIDAIIAIDPLNIRKKVTKETVDIPNH